MRKQLFWMAAAIVGTTMSLSSCSSSEDILSADLTQAQEEADAQIIKIGVTNSGDNFGTRTIAQEDVRKLRSAEALQKIENVKSVIIKLNEKVSGQPLTQDLDKYTLADNGKIVKEKLITNWNDDANQEVLTVTNGRQAIWKFTGTDKLDEGTYVIYSVGFVDQDYSESDSFKSMAVNDLIDLPRSITKATMGQQHEIFAGTQVFNVNATGQVQTTVKLQRQVAGALGYFTKIPAKGDHFHSGDDAKFVRLVSNGMSNKLMFAHFNNDFQNVEEQNQNWVMSGCIETTAKAGQQITPAPTAAGQYYDIDHGTVTDNAGYILYTINLSNWFTADANGNLDSDNNGVLDKDDTNWKKGLNEDINVRRGSVLDGEFVFPFEPAAAMANNNTFQLQLLDANKHVIRAWNVTLASNDSQRTHNVTKVKEDNTTETVAHPTDATGYGKFLVLRNHLYSIGKRTSDKPTINPDDPDPDPDDPDYPQDLTKETIQMVVMSSWEENHVMDVE